VGLLAGLANPENFRRSVEQLGARVIAERYFPDHHPYSPKDLVGLETQAPLWLTTEKDAVKIRPEWDVAKCLRVVEMDLEVSDANAFLDGLQTQLRECQPTEPQDSQPRNR
jgi:tetraacyldisaccharide 4'-kinase